MSGRGRWGAEPEREPAGPGQESVWDYPRPPVVVPSSEVVEVWFADERIARTTAALRVLETSQAPAYYLPWSAIETERLAPVTGTTWCEWKGTASYFDVVVGEHVAPRAAWTYHQPTDGFAAIRDHVAFYPGLLQQCVVDGEVVQANAGDFYGGWVTSRVVGPFKGAPGSGWW